jgi:dolichyl-phosphate-mannose--protein O-mannosyl transferase
VPLIVACGWLVALGLFFRLNSFEFPSSLLFDEHHFVENARNYLNEKADWNDHPPLGKLAIAWAIHDLGDGPLAWRLPALVYGILTLVLGALGAARLFGNWRAAMFAMAFLGADGFLIAYSRVGLLDGALATVAVAALLVATLRSPIAVSVLGGILTGVGMSIKFSGVTMLVVVVVSLLLLARDRLRGVLWSCASAALAIVSYAALFWCGLAVGGRDADLALVWSETERLFTHHAVLTDMKHPLTSGWPTWVLPVRPLVLGFRAEQGTVRALSSLGNLALWWTACALAILSLVAILRRGIDACLRPRAAGDGSPASPRGAADPTDSALSPARFVTAHCRGVLLALLAAVAFVSPWILTHRDSYIYHFLPSYAVLLILLSGYMSWAWQRRRATVLGFVVLVTVVAGYYGPVWSFLPMTTQSYQQRLPLETWR